jgi:hypothetical protein
LLDKERVGLTSRYRFYLCLYAGPNARSTGVAARVRLDPPRHDVIVEVAYPPFGYVMTIDSEPDAIESSDITAFADVGYFQRADLQLDLLIGFGHTPLPADYRTSAMIAADVEENVAAAG